MEFQESHHPPEEVQDTHEKLLKDVSLMANRTEKAGQSHNPNKFDLATVFSPIANIPLAFPQDEQLIAEWSLKDDTKAEPEKSNDNDKGKGDPRDTLQASKQHLLESANNRLFKSNTELEKWLNQWSDQIAAKRKDGVKTVSNEELADEFDAAAVALTTKRTGAAESITDEEFAEALTEVIKNHADPKEENRQQIAGTCALNSANCVAGIIHPDMFKKEIEALITGQAKGKDERIVATFKNRSELLAKWGGTRQDIGDYLGNAILAKTLHGKNYILRADVQGFQIERIAEAYERRLTGKKLPITETDFKKTGIRLQPTSKTEGVLDHCQVKLRENGNIVLYDW